MNKHFSVINIKGLVLVAILMAINAGVAGTALAMLISGGSKLWLLLIIVFITFFLISALIMIQIVSSGIDVNRGVFVMPDIDPQKGKRPQFHISQLSSIALVNHDGAIIDPDIDPLNGAKIIFKLNDGTEKEYYPISITKKQYKSIEQGVHSLIDELNNDALFND